MRTRPPAKSPGMSGRGRLDDDDVGQQVGRHHVEVEALAVLVHVGAAHGDAVDLGHVVAVGHPAHEDVLAVVDRQARHAPERVARVAVGRAGDLGGADGVADDGALLAVGQQRPVGGQDAAAADDHRRRSGRRLKLSRLTAQVATPVRGHVDAGQEARVVAHVGDAASRTGRPARPSRDQSPSRSVAVLRSVPTRTRSTPISPGPTRRRATQPRRSPAVAAGASSSTARMAAGCRRTGDIGTILGRTGQGRTRPPVAGDRQVR